MDTPVDCFIVDAIRTPRGRGKKDGSLQFIEFESIFLNQNKKLTVESLSTLVIR